MRWSRSPSVAQAGPAGHSDIFAAVTQIAVPNLAFDRRRQSIAKIKIELQRGLLEEPPFIRWGQRETYGTDVSALDDDIAIEKSQQGRFNGHALVRERLTEAYAALDTNGVSVERVQGVIPARHRQNCPNGRLNPGPGNIDFVIDVCACRINPDI